LPPLEVMHHSTVSRSKQRTPNEGNLL